MSISNKIRALLQIKGKKNVELSEYLGFSSPQVLGNKMNRASFSAKDLVKIADFLGCELAFIISDTEKISLTMEDITENASDAPEGVQK